MSLSTWAICWALLAATPVEATRLDGNKQSGEIKTLSASSLQLSSGTGVVEIPLGELQDIQFRPATTIAPVLVQLVDESILGGEKISAVAGKLTIESGELGNLALPVERVRSLQLVALDPAQKPIWEEMKRKESQADLLVIKKGDNLDFVGGTIGTIELDSIALISRGREVKVPRERVVGVVYSTHKLIPGSPFCELSTLQGSQLRVKSVTIQEERAQLELTGIPAISFSVDKIRALDFALGRIQPLMKAISRQTLPTGVSETVVAIRNHAYSPDSFEKVPLKLGNKTYSDGLLVHPQTKLEFSLNRQYRKLRAVVGIDENASDRGRFEPVVQAQLLADGKSIWEQTIRWDAPPVNLELDVTDVRSLELVTRCEDGKIGPLRHLDFADAKLIK